MALIDAVSVFLCYEVEKYLKSDTRIVAWTQIPIVK